MPSQWPYFKKLGHHAWRSAHAAAHQNAIMVAVAWGLIGVLGGALGALKGHGFIGAVLGVLAGPILLILLKLLGAPAAVHAEQSAALAAAEDKLSGLLAPSDLTRQSVHSALYKFETAYRELESVNNQSNDETWESLRRHFEVYKAAFAQLPPVPRHFHETPSFTINHAIKQRQVDWLVQPMSDLADILLHGDCDLNVILSDPVARVVRDKASQRDRFVLISLTIANRGTELVSLLPKWFLLIRPGRMHMTFEPDVEPLAKWEEHRHQIPVRAISPLEVPLHLEPHHAQVGYWCFFIGRSLEWSFHPTKAQEMVLDTFLEVHDLASGRRTKSETFVLEIAGLVKPPPSPKPEGTGSQ